MPVTISTVAGLVSNKPPIPKPLPKSPLFSKKLLSGGRTVWMSVPQPDRLTLVMPISKFVYGPKVAVEVSEMGLLQQFAQALLANYPNDVFSKAVFENKWAFALALGLSDAHVHFSGFKHKSLGPALRLEFNPRKLGKSGANALIEALGVNGLLHPTSLLNVARLTRLDVAIDVVGLQVDEIVARNAKQGIRSLYVGKDGVLETLYIHRKKSPPKAKLDADGYPLEITHPQKPAGTVLVAVYDKVRERAARGKPPPFGAAPVTRIEVSQRRFVKKKLADLATLADVLKDTFVGFSGSQVGHSYKLWDHYRRLRYAMDHQQAAATLGLQSIAATAFEAAYAVPVSDLALPEKTWLGWGKGLNATGLGLLVEKALGEIS